MRCAPTAGAVPCSRNVFVPRPVQSRLTYFAPLRSSAVASRGTMESRPAVSAHPDALRRRAEYEQILQQREAERLKDEERERTGRKWWQSSAALPSNLQTIEEPSEVTALLSSMSSDPRLLVLNFFTEECYTCKTLYPKVKQLASTHSNVLFVKVNGSSLEMQQLFERMQVTRVPYFNLYKNGAVVDHFTASLNPEKLAKLRLAVQAHL